jgi:hypothetical protein
MAALLTVHDVVEGLYAQSAHEISMGRTGRTGIPYTIAKKKKKKAKTNCFNWNEKKRKGV